MKSNLKGHKISFTNKVVLSLKYFFDFWTKTKLKTKYEAKWRLFQCFDKLLRKNHFQKKISSSTLNFNWIWYMLVLVTQSPEAKQAFGRTIVFLRPKMKLFWDKKWYESAFFWESHWLLLHHEKWMLFSSYMVSLKMAFYWIDQKMMVWIIKLAQPT